MIPFGEILQRLRNDKGWSQAQLARKVGLSDSQVANYELGRRKPSLQSLIDIARCFGVTTDYLLGLGAKQGAWLDISDLSDEEVSSVTAIVNCYRKLHRND